MGENDDGETPLFIPCRSGNLDIVKYLMDQGANINNKKS